MPHWMVHPRHGSMPVYNMSEVTQAQGNGWILLNSGESPDYSLRAKAAEPIAPQVPARAPSEPVEAPSAPLPAPSATEPVKPAPEPAKRGRPPKVK